MIVVEGMVVHTVTVVVTGTVVRNTCKYVVMELHREQVMWLFYLLLFKV